VIIPLHRRNHRRHGLTVLEMLVSTTLLLLIVIGLTAMFVQTQRAFQAGVKQSGVSDVGSTVVDMIAADLSQISDSRNQTNINFFFGWASVNSTMQYQDSLSIPFRMNQDQEIFMLVHTNDQWEGIGYAVSNNVTGAAGAGTLYRFAEQTSAPLLDNHLFLDFSNAVVNQFFPTNTCHRVADGIIHLKVYAFDQYGNENPYEYGHDFDSANAFSYPLPSSSADILIDSTNDLPGSIQLEVGILEPDTITKARALSSVGTAEVNLLSKAAGNVHVFRQQIPVAGVVR
jgi:type II secretory pathway component PulJ